MLNEEWRKATINFNPFSIPHSAFSIKNNELWTGYKH
jgi:hypothetical protein